MEEMKVFNSEEFGSVRTVTLNGKTMFVGNDVDKALGYSDCAKAIRSHCKGVAETDIPTKGGNQRAKVISEGDLYRLIVIAAEQSNNISIKRKAERFENWIFDEVLPSIRINGSYSIQTKSDSYMIEDPVERAERWIEEQKEKKQLELKIQEQQPKVEYFDALVDSRLLTNFRDTANEFEIPPQTFSKWLEDKGYIYHDKKKQIRPHTQFVQEGLFKEKDFKTPFGYSNVQTYITVKGKETFRLLLQLGDRGFVCE